MTRLARFAERLWQGMKQIERLTLEDVDAALRVAGGEPDAGCCRDGCRCAAATVTGEASLAVRLLSLMAQLDKRRQWVLNLRYGLNGEAQHTLQAIGDKMNRTRERVRQIQNAGLGKLLVLAQADGLV